MRLYNNEGATQVDDPEFGTFKPDANGAFDGLPEAMYAKLHGRPGWENDAERVARITEEQLDKMRDPATMLAELQKMSAGQGALTSLLAQALGMAPAPAPAEIPAGPAKTPEVPAETPANDTKTESQTSVPEAEQTTTTSKATSGRGRGGRAAKSAADNS